ncbi:MAG: gamma-glutamyl-gamma-aminobutyrate hydrolase family protein [Microthrixaceae bacterium]
MSVGAAGSTPDAGLPRIGWSSCFDHADPKRPLFTGKTLLYVEQSMIHWVASGGAVVYPVPTAPPGGPEIDDWVEDLDGLVLHGGADVAPESYGETALREQWRGDSVRDAYEIDLFRRFTDAGKPVLGICRGMQVINVAMGGTLHQDLVTQEVTTRVHRDAETYDRNVHEIEILDGTGLATLVDGPGRSTVNSIHHQGVCEVADGLAVEARSADDGVVEALRARADRTPNGGYVFGVQWHPEFFGTLRGEPLSGAPVFDNAVVLAEFLAACGSSTGSAGQC